MLMISRSRRHLIARALPLCLALILASAPAAGAAWSEPVNLSESPGTHPEVNTPYVEGCPMQSPNGLRLYFASNRPGGLGGLDIWMSRRATQQDPWGEPVNLGESVNSAADDFCPSPSGRGRFFFVSTRDGGCGGADIYLTKRRDGERGPARNLGCALNSAAGEASPSLVEVGRRPMLFFSSNRPDGFSPDPDGAVPDADIYVSRRGADGWRMPRLAEGLNSDAEDARPNVRRDGLVVVFDSTRPGTLGGPDIFVARRSELGAAWSTPRHLPAPINSAANETRASLSRDGETMYFGSNRPGGELDPVSSLPSNDIYRTHRVAG
jgi:Tol biopolymer transport system component